MQHQYREIDLTHTRPGLVTGQSPVYLHLSLHWTLLASFEFEEPYYRQSPFDYSRQQLCYPDIHWLKCPWSSHCEYSHSLMKYRYENYLIHDRSCYRTILIVGCLRLKYPFSRADVAPWTDFKTFWCANAIWIHLQVFASFSSFFNV